MPASYDAGGSRSVLLEAGEVKALKFRVWDGRNLLRAGSPESYHFAVSFDGDVVRAGDTGFEFAGYMSVMQYTGLKDKNGTDIYFGDLVRQDGNASVYEVWADYAGGALPRRRNAIVENWLPVRMPEAVCVTWEVVGNIYENRDLMR